ncbi:MAG: ribonuclease P protein component [Armatimonadota bacterium]
MLIREHRLTGSRDFRAVFARGKTYVHRLFVLKVLASASGEYSRFGFSTSKKLGNAVTRNRAKRLMREAVRLLLPRLPEMGYDFVLVARPPIRGASMIDVSQAVEEMLHKAGLLRSADSHAGKS